MYIFFMPLEQLCWTFSGGTENITGKNRLNHAVQTKDMFFVLQIETESRKYLM